MTMEVDPPSTSWSFLDKFSPEIFSFGFDPEILSCFWGLFRASDKTPDLNVPRLIPTAPFYIAVHSKITGGSSPLFSALQCVFTTSGVVLGVALSSYGVYTLIRTASDKLKLKNSSSQFSPHLKPSSSSALILPPNYGNSQNLNYPFLDHHLEQNEDHANRSQDYFQMSKDASYLHLQFPVRPTSLNVGIRSTTSSAQGHGNGYGHPVPEGQFKIWGPEVLQIPRDPYDEYDDLAVDLEDMSDIRGEYFGPAPSDVELDSFDDSSGSSNSNFQTPCA